MVSYGLIEMTVSTENFYPPIDGKTRPDISFLYAMVTSI